MIPDEPFLAFTRKKDQREKITLNVGSENDLCPDSWNLIVYFSVFLQLFCAFGFFISLFVVGIVRQRMRFRFCTRKVPGRWSLHSFLMIAAIGIENGPCETRPFFSFSSPFPLPFLYRSSPFSFPFLYSSFSFSFPFSFPFSFLFPFPFLFLSFSFSFPFFPFRFPFLSLSFSFPFPFPLPFLFFPFPSFTLPFPFPFVRSRESFGQGVKPALGKGIGPKKNVWKNIWKGSGFLQPPYIAPGWKIIAWSSWVRSLFCFSSNMNISRKWLSIIAVWVIKKYIYIYILTDWNLECAPFFQKSLFRKLRMQRSPGRRPDS